MPFTHDNLMAEEDHQFVSDESVDDEEVQNPPAYDRPSSSSRQTPTRSPIADRHNATTASCNIRDLGGTVKVTLCVAQPPLVSYLCVHVVSPFVHKECFSVEPQIIATETDGGLVLLRLAIGEHPPDVTIPFYYGQYFMYDASGPSLEHLPHPGYYRFDEHSVAIVRKCSNRSSQEDHDCSSICVYVLAAQSCGFGYAESPHLILYHSDTKTWRKVPVIAKSYPTHSSTDKTLTIGGDKGTVAWVDLWRNILLCDVLDERPVLRTLMPMLIMVADDLVSNNPRSVRDIAVLGGGYIRYVELQYRLVEQGLPGHSFYYIWKVAVWSIDTAGTTSSSSEEDWHIVYLINSTEIPGSSLPRLQVDEGKPQPTLSSLHIGLPNLSLQDDDIVYFLTKSDFLVNTQIAWVLAIDMRNKTVQDVGEFNSMRTGLESGYSASRISKYLKAAQCN
ncbi:unnamed protein product [Alopecurus aequalis]